MTVTLYTRSPSTVKLFDRLMAALPSVSRAYGNPADWHPTVDHADLVLTSAALSREVDAFAARCTPTGQPSAQVVVLNASEKAGRLDAFDWAVGKLSTLNAAGQDVVVVGADMRDPGKAVKYRAPMPKGKR